MENNPDQFIVYPAIDMRAGHVVRLVHGEKKSQTTYLQDPVEAANMWIEAGAEWLHVVNLDGAFGEKSSQNLQKLSQIVSTCRASDKLVHIQFGGGLRSLKDIQRAIELGISRVVLGTAAVNSPQLIASALEQFNSQHVALALDIRKNRVRIHGWEKETLVNPIILGKRMFEMGVRTCVYTNIEKDGTMLGVDLASTQEYAQKTRLSVIASGGIATIEEIRAVKQAGLNGVIIGRALYEGKIQLEEAIAC